MFFKCFLFPATCQKHVGIFLWYSQNCGTPLWLGPLEFVSLLLVHTEPSVIHQLQFRFCCSGTGSREVCAHVFLLQWAVILHIHLLPLQFWRQQAALWLHVSYESKKSCRFLSLFGFSLVTVEWVVVSKHITCGSRNPKSLTDYSHFWSHPELRLRILWAVFSGFNAWVECALCLFSQHHVLLLA